MEIELITAFLAGNTVLLAAILVELFRIERTLGRVTGKVEAIQKKCSLLKEKQKDQY